MAELQPIIVFHGSHFVRHIGISNLICVKLLQIVWCYPAQFKKIPISNRHTHDDSIRQNAVRCISPKNETWQYGEWLFKQILL